jgi:hypothetical protein
MEEDDTLSLAIRPPLPKKLKQHKVKPGPKVGSANQKIKRTRGDWYRACHVFRNLPEKMLHKSFLQSEISGPLFDGRDSQRVSFIQHLKQYDAGTLQPNEILSRSSKGEYPEVEKKLIQYIDLRAERYGIDGLGSSWGCLQFKAMEYAQQLGISEDKFSASPGWISNCLIRNGKVILNLQGEAGDMAAAEREKIMNEWRTMEFWPMIERYNVPMSCIYNADQTGLFYQKLPNTIYVDKSRKKEYKGAKQMKDKTRCTLMVCTSAEGGKIPLAFIGKPKKPSCFKLCENGKPPLPYANQPAAWFDKNVTWWWLHEVFIPHHTKYHGHAHCILLLDNFSGHHVNFDALPKWLHVLFLPPNQTNTHQPADMGMISSLKTGYKAIMLKKLLGIFDTPGGYEAAAEARKHVPKGQRGLTVGGKAHILDAMIIFNDIWKQDGKYARVEGIRRCWRKADILPLEMNTEINMDLGTLSIAHSKKTMRQAEEEELCTLMSKIQVKARETNVNCSTDAIALQNSFASEGFDYTDAQLSAMISNWVNIEDEPEIINALIDDELEALEKKVISDEYMNVMDDDEPEIVNAVLSDEEKLSYSDMQKLVQQLVVNSKAHGVESDTALLHRYSAQLRKAQQQKATGDGRITNFFERLPKTSNT